MTLNAHKALEQYFHAINQPKQKEATMFEYLKNKWTELTTTKYEFVEEPETLPMEDYWAFEIHTGEWVDEFNEVIPSKHDVIIKDNDSTWHEVLDQILDVMGEHYGYNIKEQVYYSVAFPNNTLYYSPDGKPQAGYGRMLNDDVLQQLLLAYPEVYEMRVNGFEWKPL
jgi:YesN/AraC family two-component response regulator